MVVIRRIEPGEGELLRQIRLAALLDAPSGFASRHADEANRSDATWSELAEARSTGFDQATFLAFSCDEVVGVVGGFRQNVEPLTIELVSMWTSPWTRRMGVAAQLVQVLLAWARAAGARSVELWVTEANVPAMSLYRSLGFATTGESAPLRPGADEQVQRMSLALTESL